MLDGKTLATPSDQVGDADASIRNREIGPRWAIIGIFLILLGGALYLTASFTLPVVVALLFAMVLSPLVRVARRRLHIREPISAAVLVTGIVFGSALAFYMLSGPVTAIVMDAPAYRDALNGEVSEFRARLDEFRNAQQTLAESGPDVADDQPAEVVVSSPTLLDNAATSLPQIAASILFSLIFLFFLLSSGDLIRSKLVKSMPTLSDKKRAVTVASEIERELSRYLFTITIINLSLGIVIGSILWFAGMPTPAVFGALAFLLNYIPYIGAVIGIGLVGVIALAEFGSLGQALVPMLLYLACTTVEGQLITPMVVGRRLKMNAAAVFLAVAFWGWIWGVVGMFLAVPILVFLKILSGYISGLDALGTVISAELLPDEDE